MTPPAMCRSKPRYPLPSFMRAIRCAGGLPLRLDPAAVGECIGSFKVGHVAKVDESELRAERIFKVGHSVGGQVTGLLDNADQIDGMITLSAQSGHWRLQGGEQKWAAAFHVHVTLPVLATVMGYMPWRWIGAGEDLPKGAALEWAGWCRNRDYLLGDKTLPLDRFAGFAAPILAYSIDDDKWGTSRAVDAMMSAYPNVKRRHIVPSEHDLPSIGHFGFFRPQAKPLWEEGIAWLDAIR